MTDLSVVIAARNEEFLQNTIDNVLENIRGDTEIIVILDGYWPDDPISQHKRLTIIHHEESIGQRAAINEGVKLSESKYMMKLDAHCTVDEGFDVKLMADCEHDWTVVPRMYNLHAFDWKCKRCGNRTYHGPKPKKCTKCGSQYSKKVIVFKHKTNPESDYMLFDSDLKFGYWRAFKKRPEAKGEITDLMSFIGACWFMEIDRYWEIGGLDETFGSWGQVGSEISIKSWTSGGRLVVNKKTFFSHMFRTGHGFGFPYKISGNQVKRARTKCQDMFRGNKWPMQKRPLSWMLDKFWPIPGWSDEARLLISNAGSVFSASHSFTNDTNALNSSGSSNTDASIFQRMSPSTMGLSASKHILSVGDGLNVGGIATTPIVTNEMVKLKAVGDGSEKPHVGKSMDPIPSVLVEEFAVPSTVEVAIPKPAVSNRIDRNVAEKTSDSSTVNNKRHKKSIVPVETNVKQEKTKGIVYYTDNQCQERIATTVRSQLLTACNGHKIVSVSQYPLDFGKNIVMPIERSIPSMFKQMLEGLKNIDTEIVFFCFQGNTQIETINGQKRIDKIKKGELVKTHLNRFRVVKKIFKREYKQRSPLIQINTNNSFVRCTPEHPFFVYRDNKKQWIEAKSINVEDLLIYPSKNKKDYLKFDIQLKSSSYGGRYGSMDRYINKLKIDKDFARFMGLYLAEGHFNGKNGIGFTFNNEEKDYQNFIKKVCKEKFGRDAKKRVQWATQILININQLGPLFKKWFGKNAKNKRIPKFVFKWNLENKLSFIKGVLEGDGGKHKSKKYYTYLVSASKGLIKDFIKLTNESGVGWDNNIKSRVNIGGFAKKEGMAYWTNFSKMPYMKLLDIIDSEMIDDDFLGIKIKSIVATKMSSLRKQKNNKFIKYDEAVYNLEVDEDNSYITQSMIVHNCEHDVLYHPSHFNFIPPKNDVYYYNDNIWKLDCKTGQALQHAYMKQVSGLVAYRSLLIEHYTKRVERVEKEGKYNRKIGFEPGKNLPKGIDNYKYEYFTSEHPNIDIKHSGTVTPGRFKLEQYRCKNKIKDSWTLADIIPYWGKTKGRFDDFLRGLSG